MSLLSTAFRLSNSHVDFCLCLGSDAPIMADFGSASATSQGNSVFDDQCDGAIDLTLTEQVVLATFVPLSEAQAQQGISGTHSPLTHHRLRLQADTQM